MDKDLHEKTFAFVAEIFGIGGTLMLITFILILLFLQAIGIITINIFN